MRGEVSSSANGTHRASLLTLTVLRMSGDKPWKHSALDNHARSVETSVLTILTTDSSAKGTLTHGRLPVHRV